MTIRQKLEKAVTARDAAAVGRIVTTLRFRFGMNYDGIYEFVNEVAPISRRDWETLLYDSESTQ